MPSDQWTLCRVRNEIAEALDKLAGVHQTTRAAMAEALLWHAIEQDIDFHTLGHKVVKRHRSRDDWRHGRTSLAMGPPRPESQIPRTEPLAPTRHNLKGRPEGIPYTPMPGVPASGA